VEGLGSGQDVELYADGVLLNGGAQQLQVGAVVLVVLAE
jgi:hypothetical protein